MREDLSLTLLRDIVNRENYTPMRHILNTGTVLSPKQAIDVVRMLYLKKGCISHATGMGKTIMACAYMKALKNKYPDCKFLMFVRNDQLLETPAKILEHSGIRILSMAGDEKSFSEKWSNNLYKEYDGVMLSVSTLIDPSFMTFLLIRRKEFRALILDEVHGYCNFEESLNGQMIHSIAKNFEYVLGLTATPIITKERTLGDVMSTINRDDFDNPKEYLSNYKSGCLLETASIVVREREENNHRGIIVPVNIMAHQMTTESKNEEVFKGPKAMNQIRALIRTVMQHKIEGQKGLIYVNLGVIFDFVAEQFDKMGIKYEIINGTRNSDLSERQKITKRFKTTDDYDVIISNITTAIDIDCDYVAFYELTSDFEQTIGRTERGLESKDLPVYWIVTLQSEEVAMFKNRVYIPSLKAQKLLGKSHKEINEAAQQLIDAGEMCEIEI